MTHKDCALIIFSKAPVPGQVKTRLVPVVGEEGAAGIYRSLLERTLNTVSQTDFAEIFLSCTPTVIDSYLQKCAIYYPLRLQLQKGGNLGQRMYGAFEYNLSAFRSAIIVGCDCPELTVDDLNSAYEMLQREHEVVIGPAEDGGYYLIGMNAPNKFLFENINWGGSEVLSTTRARIQEAGLNCFEIQERWDVDRPEDLERYYSLDKAQ